MFVILGYFHFLCDGGVFRDSFCGKIATRKEEQKRVLTFERLFSIIRANERSDKMKTDRGGFRYDDDL